MTTPHLTDDDVRDLFSDHLEGALDDDTARAVDAAIAANAELASEYRAFAETVSLLRALPATDTPDALVGQVRDRLTAERRAEAMQASAANDDHAAVATTPWWSPMRLAAGVAAAAAVTAIIMVAAPHEGKNGPSDMLGAGLHDEAVSVSWQVPGLAADVVAAAALEAGMGRDGDAFVGDRAAAARFFVALKTRAAGAGSDVSGAVPERAERLIVTIAH